MASCLETGVVVVFVCLFVCCVYIIICRRSQRQRDSGGWGVRVALARVLMRFAGTLLTCST